MPTEQTSAAPAIGRSIGAIIFAIFGAVWILLGVYAFHHLTLISLTLILLAALLLAITATRLLRRAKQLGIHPSPEYQQSQTGRTFALVNALQGIAIFLDWTFIPRTRYAQFTVSIMALIVGLHFFILPKFYRRKSNLITGALITLWALLCPAFLRNDALIAWTALGAGVILWTSSASALWKARQLLSPVSE